KRAVPCLSSCSMQGFFFRGGYVCERDDCILPYGYKWYHVHPKWINVLFLPYRSLIYSLQEMPLYEFLAHWLQFRQALVRTAPVYTLQSFYFFQQSPHEQVWKVDDSRYF